MSADRAAEWIYRGLWGALTAWFRVPQSPPTLPTAQGEPLRSFRPSEGWLRMRRFQFWLGLTIIDGLLLIAWVVLFVAQREAALWVAAPWLFVMVAPDILVYIAIHLRYDTTWYVLSARSVRIRRRIWTIEEKTFTFENVQNVKIHQGPVQRWFGVSDLVIQTAGGGSSAAGHGASMGSAHEGRIEGVRDAQEIRELIMSKVRAARSAGLGDDDHAGPGHAGFSSEHLAALREIRGLAATLAARA